MTITRIEVRRGTTAQWSAANPTLLSGEFGLDTTLGEVKIGDDSTPWATLPFLARVKIASKAITYAALTDADLQQDVAFDAALPAGAIILGSVAVVATAFDNVGGTAVVTCDLGYAADRAALIDGAALKPAATVSTPRGTTPSGFVGAVTPSVRFDSSVNLNTLTTGAATFYVVYALAF